MIPESHEPEDRHFRAYLALLALALAARGAAEIVKWGIDRATAESEPVVIFIEEPDGVEIPVEDE